MSSLLDHLRVAVVPKDRLQDAASLFQRSFGFADRDVVPAWEMFLGARYGALPLGGFLQDDLVAFSYAFPGVHLGVPMLYSNGLAVRADLRSSGIGHRMKLEQRRIALTRGIELIRWTANPLAAPALRLYLTRLGAVIDGFSPKLVEEFLPGIATDEVEIAWDLTRAPKGGSAAGPETRLVSIPADWRALRDRDPTDFDRRRCETGEQIGQLCAQGYVGVGVRFLRESGDAAIEFRRGAPCG